MRSPLLAHFRWWPRRIQALPPPRYANITLVANSGQDWTLEGDHESSHSAEGGRNARVQQYRNFTIRKHAPRQRSDNILDCTIQMPPIAQHPKSWLEYLEQLKFRYGSKGIDKVWEQIKERRLCFGPEEPSAIQMWTALFTAFKDRPDKLEEVINYSAQLYRTTWRHWTALLDLLEDVMLHILRQHPEHSLNIYALLRDSGLSAKIDAKNCIIATAESVDISAAFRCFQWIYIYGTDRNLYDDSLNILQSSDASYRTIAAWHKFLLSQGDGPSDSFKRRPLVLSLLRKSTHANEASVAITKVSQPAIKTIEVGKMEEEPLDSVIAELDGVKQKSVTDAFCARVFATGGFSNAFLLAGLSVLGLDTIGPLAMRELAARSHNIADFQEAMRIVRERNISITKCVFSKALNTFAEEDRQDMFDRMVQSDRHPDTYEDRELLEKLADHHLAKKESLEAHTILAILSLSSQHRDEYQWNLLLQAEARAHQPQRVSSVITDMMGRDLHIDDASISGIRTNLLRPRKAGNRPITQDSRQVNFGDDLTEVTNLLLTLARYGTSIHVSHWKELMKRYGMAGRMSGLRFLSLELIDQHLATPDSPSQVFRIGSPLRTLFNRTLQRAIVTWGFRSDEMSQWRPRASIPSKTGSDSSADGWLQGLSLLAQMRDTGLPIDVPAVRAEVVLRLEKSFMPKVDFVDGVQRVTTRDDHELLRRYDLIEQTWAGKGLLRFCHGELGRQAAATDRTAWVLYHLFGRTSAVRKRRKKLLDASKGKKGDTRC